MLSKSVKNKNKIANKHTNKHPQNNDRDKGLKIDFQ